MFKTNEYHSLIFVGINTREIAKIFACDQSGNCKPDKEIKDEAMEIIHAFTKEKNFKIHYLRIWNSDGRTIFDAGSHTEFFHLIPAVSLE